MYELQYYVPNNMVREIMVPADHGIQTALKSTAALCIPVRNYILDTATERGEVNNDPRYVADARSSGMPFSLVSASGRRENFPNKQLTDKGAGSVQGESMTSFTLFVLILSNINIFSILI